MNPIPDELRSLVAQLKASPTRDERVTLPRLRMAWDRFKTLTPESGATINPALLVGLILFDSETFAPLLTAAEHAQLAALGNVARERYQQLTDPPNQLGKTLLAAVKEQP